MAPLRVALVGLGKISLDEHIPAIRASEAFVLAGSVSPRHRGVTRNRTPSGVVPRSMSPSRRGSPALAMIL